MKKDQLKNVPFDTFASGRDNIFASIVQAILSLLKDSFFFYFLLQFSTLQNAVKD